MLPVRRTVPTNVVLSLFSINRTARYAHVRTFCTLARTSGMATAALALWLDLP